MTTRIFYNARIFTPIHDGNPVSGARQGRLSIFDNGALLVKNDTIEAVGDTSSVLKHPDAKTANMIVDCVKKCMIPGFVDPHTHMCFACRRESEFEMRLTGVSYMDILRRGGGILSSVNAVVQADEDALYENTLSHALSAMRFGTTTLEIKSGYGLDTENELKMLRVIDRVAQTTPLDVIPTFLGAHAVPPTFRNDPEGYVDLVIKEMLPAVKTQGIARYCDVFCEKGVFSLDQSRRILSAAKALGLDVKLHADEVHDLGGAGLAADLGAVSADHLLAAGDDHLRAMAAAGTVAILLPVTAYSLKKAYARARDMIALGLPVALATDCNPGSSYSESMPFAFGLAVMNMDMTPAEALTAATLNAAYALKMADRTGSLTPGKQADFLLLDGKSPAILAYHAGVSSVTDVYKLGEKVA